MTSTPLRYLVLGLIVLASPAAPSGQGTQTATVRVTETSGIRRTEYPVRAQVSVPAGVRFDAMHAQLRLNDQPVPAQYTVTSLRREDQMPWTLDVDFNVTLAPAESRTYQLAYGADVTAAAPPRGLALTEEADAIQIGGAKFSRRGQLTSASYVRSEFISQLTDRLNGFRVIDTAGGSRDLMAATNVDTIILKRGPLSAAVSYSAQLAFEGSYTVPCTLIVEMPNSKSWIKMSATIIDPAARVKEMVFDTPLSLGATFPLLWDFGTENGTYGAFRTASDAAMFTQVVDAFDGGTTSWKIDAGTGTELRPFEASLRQLAPGWGHLQGSTQAVAFAIDGMDKNPGTYTIGLSGDGQVSYRFSPVRTPPANSTRRFTIYQHFVSTPVPIGAATTPMSMLHPPLVEVNGK